MVYLEADQLQALRKKARIERISVAELIRRCVRLGLQDQTRVSPPVDQEYARLIGIGSSGRTDIGDEHDDRLARALTDEHLR
jgi:hypothetical protein